MLAESVAHQKIGSEALSTRAPDPSERRLAAKAHLRRLGMTLANFADRHSYKRRTVYKVMAGDLDGHFGVSHNIAVRLGLKDGEIDPSYEPAQPVEAAHG